MKPAFDGGDIVERLTWEDRRPFWDKVLFAETAYTAILEGFERAIPMVRGYRGGIAALEFKSRKSAHSHNPGVMAGQQPFLKLHQRRNCDILEC